MANLGFVEWRGDVAADDGCLFGLGEMRERER